MSTGHTFKRSFGEFLRRMGCTVLIHKDWSTPQQKTTEVRSLKNNEKNRPSKVMFQFPERIDIEVGDILQQKGTQDLWKVIDVEDEVIDDVYVMFEAKVEKFPGPRTSDNRHKSSSVVIHGPNFGGIQIDSPQGVQNISVQALQLDENIKKLKHLLDSTPVDELDKEEASLALDRISQLARKEKTEGIITQAKEKIDFVKSIFEVSKDVYVLAGPYISALSQYF